jgi:RimJ/RimL family protein N-acetyltransferase
VGRGAAFIGLPVRAEDAEDPEMNFSVKPVLTGERAVLRPFTEDDVPVMAEILHDPAVIRLTGSPAEEFDPERLRSWYASRNSQVDRLDLGIVDRASGELVGEAVLNEWDERNRNCSFRILIGPGGRDRGLGTEAVRLICDYAFRIRDLHRLSLETLATNEAMLRAAKAAGFVEEGRQREAAYVLGERVDEILLGLLRSEWAPPSP